MHPQGVDRLWGGSNDVRLARCWQALKALRRERFPVQISPGPSNLIRTTGCPGGTRRLFRAMCPSLSSHASTGRNARVAAKRAVVGRTLMPCIIVACMLIPVRCVRWVEADR